MPITWKPQHFNWYNKSYLFESTKAMKFATLWTWIVFNLHTVIEVEVIIATLVTLKWRLTEGK